MALEIQLNQCGSSRCSPQRGGSIKNKRGVKKEKEKEKAQLHHKAQLR